MPLAYSLAALSYLAVIVLFAALHARGGYSITADAVSDYAIGPTERLFELYGLAGTVAAVALAVGVIGDGRLPARGGLLLIALVAVRQGVMIFPTDLEGKPHSFVGRLHFAFAIASFALAYIAIAALDQSTADVVAGWGRTPLAVLRLVVELSLVGVTLCLLPPLKPVFGLLERSFLLFCALWLGTFALAML